MMACQTPSPRPVPGDIDQPCTNSGPQPVKLTIRLQEQECHHDTTLDISWRLPMPPATQRVFCNMLRPVDLWRTVAMLQSGSTCCLPLSLPVCNVLWWTETLIAHVRSRPHVCCGLRVHVCGGLRLREPTVVSTPCTCMRCGNTDRNLSTLHRNAILAPQRKLSRHCHLTVTARNLHETAHRLHSLAATQPQQADP